MNPKRKRILKVGAIVVSAVIVIAVSIVLYLFNMPHRNVQNTKSDYKMSSSELVKEYLENETQANARYLMDDGDSKILEITGHITQIKENYDGQKVLILKETNDKAGVSCTFTTENNNHAENLQIGDLVTIKGVIRAGASYNEGLDMYENVIIEKSDLLIQ
jgi:hypothetical protein